MKNSKIDFFIHRAKLVHGNKYDYSKVEYANNHTKVCIICPVHGEFLQTPKGHLKGQGCRLCYNQRTKERLYKTTDQFIKESKFVHGDKYDYSKVHYIGCFDKVCIICPEHGEFWQKPQHHLQGCGCIKCGYIKNGLKSRVTLESFIERANEIHEYKYDYSKSEYIDTHSKVCIICPEHGEFWQTPLNHLQGHGCSKCNMSILENDVRIMLINKSITYESQKSFTWLKDHKSMFLDFYIKDKQITVECQGIQHFTLCSYFGGYKEFKSTQNRDILKYQQCKGHNIEVIYYFPKEYLKYNIEFYKDKKYFHTIDDLKDVFE